MNQFPVAIITMEPPIDAKDAFDRLTFLGWRWGLAAIVAGLAASFFLFGYALVYWRNADMDFMVIYNALVLNDGKPQLFFDHTGYITILSVKGWFQLLHHLGLLDAYSLSDDSARLRRRRLRCRHDQRRSRRARSRLADRNRLRAGFCRACPPHRARLARRADRNARVRILRWHRGAFAYFAHRTCRGVPRHLRAADPDRDRAPRRHRAPVRDRSCGSPLRARSRKQGAGHPADRHIAAGGAAVRKRGKRQRCILAACKIRLAGGDCRNHRGAGRGVGGVAADRHRFRSHPARCRAVSSAACSDASASIRSRC